MDLQNDTVPDLSACVGDTLRVTPDSATESDECDEVEHVQLTESWREALPQSVQDRYDIVETRNAAAVMQVTTPEAFKDMIQVLEGFTLTLDKLTTPGGNKSVIAKELDTTFRERGWREAKFDQDLTTNLTIYRWTGSPTPEQTRTVSSKNSYGGHKVDNVLGRAALDVEWNPKDGNLDRDIANYVSLHEGGVIDVGVIVTRSGDALRTMVRDIVSAVKAVPYSDTDVDWAERMTKLANDPLGTTTTANFEKLVPRLERGDARGCPVLAIAITDRTYTPPQLTTDDEVRRLITLAADVHPSLDEPIEDATEVDELPSEHTRPPAGPSIRTDRIGGGSHDSAGFGAGDGTVERYEYRCPCSEGKVIEEHDNIPGFRDHSVWIDCDKCREEWIFINGKSVREWRLTPKLADGGAH